MNYIDFAIDTARESGRIQMENLGKVHNIEYKNVTDIVTGVDKKCEELIVSRIKKTFPSHGILAEEGGGHLSKSDWKWIVDPLDGTTNFAHSYPLSATSIALEHKGEIVLGVVYEPNRDEMFAAEKGGGATKNGGRIKVSQTTDLRKALLDTGFAYNTNEGEIEDNIKNFIEFLFKARALRRDGAAAVDLCYVAAGRFDGFWEFHLKPWDVAAGSLIIKEAGGRVTMFDGGELDIYGSEILASNGLIHESMLQVLG